MNTIKQQQILRSQQDNVFSNASQSNKLIPNIGTIFPLTRLNDISEDSCIDDKYNRFENL